jgi:DNA-binding response OmpR family regulator
VLVVEDDAATRDMLRRTFEQDGWSVCEAGNGLVGLDSVARNRPELIILDLMMPEMGGYEFMRLYGKEADTPIIILTAKIEESDRVLGLELGADDYITKPFSMRELVARIHAVLRRTRKGIPKSAILRAADIELDHEDHTVTVGQTPVDLTPSEFNLLAALMTAPGRVFSRSELLEEVQDGIAFEGVERTIDVHIRNLRTKIEPDPGSPRYIQTVYGVGYRFSAAADME